MAFSAIARPGSTTTSLASGVAPRDPELVRRMLAGEANENDMFRGPVNKSTGSAPTAGGGNAGTPANQADFFGEGTNAGPAAPPPRPTSPDGLTYTDTGEPTPLYHQRKQLASGAVTPGSALGQQYLEADRRRIWAPSPEERAQGWEFNSETGLYQNDYGNGDVVTINNDPRRRYDAGNPPAYTVSNTPDGLRVGPGEALPGDNGQRLATQQEADAANRNIAATGDSHPGGGVMDPTIAPGSMRDLEGLSAAGQATFRDMARERATTGADMFAQGAAANGRRAARSGQVDYGPSQTIAAPTVAGSRNAAAGSFGSQQTVRAANVGSAAQATAARANATSAADRSGFLAGTAANARNIADLDFGQANQSREALGQSVNRLNAYADQGPGESAAQAQLRQQSEQNLGAALSLARSGRGNGAGNMKMAIAENAATNAETNMQAATLRAQEADAWRGRQLQAMGLAQEGTTNMRSQDIGAAQAQGQQAISREQIASNVDVSRAGLQQGLAQFNAGAQNQASLANAQLATSAALQNAAETNAGRRLQAQLTTDASGQTASLANARNIAMGNAGTQVNMQNAAEANQGARLQAQLSSEAVNNQAQLANALAIAQGNSNTQVNLGNLDADVAQRQLNDSLRTDLYGLGVDLGQQQLNAANAGVGTAFDYANLGAEIDWRALDREAGIRENAKDRKSKREAAIIGGAAALAEAAF